MRFLKPFCVAALVVAAAPLSAQSIMDEPAETLDLATVTCKQLMGMPTAGMGIRIVYWLDGYYRDDEEPTVVDTDKIRRMIVALGEHCAKNETQSVIAAAETLFVKRK